MFSLPLIGRLCAYILKLLCFHLLFLTMVDVSGLDREELLKALWEGAKVVHTELATGKKAPEWDDTAAYHIVRSFERITVLFGRTILADVFSDSDTIDPKGYDRANGRGQFQHVVNTLRKLHDEEDEEQNNVYVVSKLAGISDEPLVHVTHI
jgi:hypothetical protein